MVNGTFLASIRLHVSEQTGRDRLIIDEWPQKTIKKQIMYFIDSILKAKPAMMNDLHILVFAKDKRVALSDKTLEQYNSDRNRDILDGYNELTPQTEIRKIELRCNFELGKDFNSRKGFISSVESNFTNFYSQFIEPFSV